MNKKVGKFKLWQLIAIGGILGVIVYEYEKSKGPKEPKSELAGSAVNPSGGGEGSLGAVPPIPGAPGEPGPPGPQGPPPGPPEVTGAQLAAIESQIAALNIPPTGRATVAPHTSKFPLRNPATGEHYKIVKEKGKTLHVYHNGHVVTVGGGKPNRKHGNQATQNKKTARRNTHSPPKGEHSGKHAAAVAPIHRGPSKSLAERVRPTPSPHPAPKAAPKPAASPHVTAPSTAKPPPPRKHTPPKRKR